MNRLTRIAAIAAAATTLAGTVQAETWQFSANDIDANFHTENARLFAEDVARLSGGDMTIEVVSGAALLSRADLRRGVQRGVVPMGDLLIGALGNDNAIFNADSIPLLATTFDEAQRLWDITRPMYEEILAEDGLMILWAEPWPSQGIYTTEPITSADSLEGVNFRAYNAATARFAELMGAIPTTIPSSEVSQAFSTGLVDGMITSPTTGVDTQAWDFASHFYNVQAMIPKNFILVNTGAFEALTPENQAAILEAAQIAEARGWEMGIAAQEAALATLAENGMIVEPTPPAIEARLEEVAATMLEEWQAEGGEAVAAIVSAFNN
jgi:TRAP-type C4-dicarboxylate transport system substrate-binding protein